MIVVNCGIEHFLGSLSCGGSKWSKMAAQRAGWLVDSV